MKYTLTLVSRKDADKSGKPFVTKDGRPFQRIYIKVAEEPYKDKLVSGFSNSWNQSWALGNTVEADIVPSADGQFLNLVKPDPIGHLSESIQELSVMIMRHEKEIKLLKDFMQQPQADEPVVDDISLPF